ncbi:AAA domain-containing protein [Kitasatospora purpeofusca]|uniref:AAA domain-containing protein n=1 Tax=Kitasatospora purpeofusca TaxID=67352 RepID=UPI0022574648|nr:AAA domain-containing protein [Kitasatospora purpeofusca]MCX4758288.1 AAA domain-containing protein [Kitasatospora purpeofusca]WSR31255.1 AAA domain-containing protein [Kitasatospora purpeofusca]
MTQAEHPYPVPELLAAVQAEIRAERRNDAKEAEKAALSDGRPVSVAEGRYEYLFACRRWPGSFDGSPVLVRPSQARGDWIPGEASPMPDGKVRLVVAENLPAGARNVQVRKDDSAGLLVLAERLKAAGSDDGGIRVESAGWIVGQGSPAVGRAADPERWVAGWNGLKLNPRQRTAVAQALASEALFLWGPPGTGKTDVVGHIVEGNVRQGHSVLFLAPTKVAVDQALERICDLLKAETGFAEGLVQRAGEIELPSLRERYGDYVDPTRIAGRVSAQLGEEARAAREALQLVRAGVTLHDEVRELEQRLADDRKAHQNAADAAGVAERDALRVEAEAARLRLAVSEAREPKGLFSGRKERELAALRDELTRATDAAFASQYVGAAARKQAEELAARISTTTGRLSGLRPRLEGLPAYAVLVHEAGRLQERVQELDRQLARIQQTVRSQCRVMGATVAKAVQSRKLLDRVDVVVVDEAGMVDLPSAWLAAGLAGKRIVVAGDFRQLPAVTKGDGDRKATEDERAHARYWAARDAFHAAGLVSEHGSVRQDARLVALDTQYRMREPICRLVNAVAYPDAPLATGRGDGSRIPLNPLIDVPVILVDTSKQRIPGPDYRANTVNEAVVHELVRGLQYEGVLPGHKWGAAEIGVGERATDRLAVIAPYRAQVKALKGSLKYRFGEDYEGLVDTIHRFQGSQRPIVVFDTAVGAGKDPGIFYAGTGLSSQTCRLLNVALSRAQDHLVVVADVEHLRKHLGPHSEARVMLDHLERHAQVISADQLIPTRDAAQLPALSEEELARPAFFPADEVQKAVEWDIARARTSVEVYCAFLDPAPVRRWSALLGARVAEGVEVVVHTRSPEEQREAAGAARHQKQIDILRAAGCQVGFRERMHEKVLILDSAVLWHGSLNLLASSGPTDLMMRFTDPASCERVSRVIDRARKERAAWNPRAAGESADSVRPSAVRHAAPSATGTGIRPGDLVDGRLYLDVPYGEKDEAKALLRARWDKPNGLWYVEAARVTREQAARWLP